MSDFSGAFENKWVRLVGFFYKDLWENFTMDILKTSK